MKRYNFFYCFFLIFLSQILKYVRKAKPQQGGTDYIYEWKENWFPSLFEMFEAGIEFCIVDQHPGDLLAAGPGCLHFVLKPVSYCLVS